MKRKDYSKTNVKLKEIDDWKALPQDSSDEFPAYYPLYWGKDANMGSRLHAHTKTHIGTGTLQLNNATFLEDKEVIYGAVPCNDSKNIEVCLQAAYPHIMKTTEGEKLEEKS